MLVREHLDPTDGNVQLALLPQRARDKSPMGFERTELKRLALANCYPAHPG